MALQDYIVVDGLKFSVDGDSDIQDDFPALTEHEEEPGLDGVWSQSVGFAKRRFKWTIIVHESGEAVGYGTYAQAKALYTNYATVSITNLAGASYTAFVVNRDAPAVRWMDRVPYESTSKYLFELEMQEV